MVPYDGVASPLTPGRACFLLSVPSLLLVNEIIGDVAIAHELQAGALIVELGTGLAAIEKIEGGGIEEDR